jgi:glyoxylase-like metal-dependent hydrolase (beta-lactamase superfamily II)
MSTAHPLGDGIVAIDVPIPDNPLGHTWVYVLESKRGLILIDAGWDAEESWRGLQDGLRAAGAGIDQVEGVLVTHFHPDHTGLCARVREASGAWIAMHEADRAEFIEVTEPRDRQWLDRAEAEFRTAGAGPSDCAAIRQALDAPPRAVPDALADRWLTGDELIRLTGRTLRAIHTPGHTPGHLCFHLESADTVFTGDHVLARTTPHVGSLIHPLADDDALGDFLASQRRIAAMPETRALGAHGAWMPQVAARAENLIHHHQERLNQLLAAFEDRELTVWQAASRMNWYRPWDEIRPGMKTLALCEAGAHLRHLVSRGLLEKVPDTELLSYRLHQ